MSTSLPQSAANVFETVGDVLARFGDLPATRILTKPTPGTAVEADVLAAEARGKLCELVDGVLIEKAMGAYESQIAAYLIYLLYAYLKDNPIGTVFAESGMVRMAAGNVRIPDVSFYRWERFPDRRSPRVPINTVEPDLAVEVLSASNTQGEMRQKVSEYFTSGVTLVWLIDPVQETATVFSSPEDSSVVRREEFLDGKDVLPGFRAPLSELFDRWR